MARKPAPKRIKPDDLTAHHRVAIVHGEDRLLQQLYIDALRSVLEKEHGEIEPIRLDGKTDDAATILDEARSFGLMASHRLIVVEDADALLKREGVRPMFERYAEAPSDGATLVLRASSWRPGNLDKKVDAGGGVIIPCKALDAPGAVRWIGARAQKQHGVTIETQAAAQLVELTGTDLARLDAELGTLAARAGEGNAITRQLVSEMVGMSREESAWVVQEPLLRADASAALSKVHELLTVSRVPPILVRRSLIDLAKKLHAVSTAAHSGGNPAKPGASVRVWGPVVDAGRRVRPEAARKMLELAIEADRNAKTGRGDEVRGLEVLTARFASLIAS
ncbi:MAG: DNA polymerase III subunit delta [Planctomycetota bacterium]